MTEQEFLYELSERKSKISKLLLLLKYRFSKFMSACTNIFKKTPPPPPPRISAGQKIKMAATEGMSQAADLAMSVAPTLIKLALTIAIECTGLGGFIASHRPLAIAAQFAGYGISI